ncbi:unnamed protein product [Trichobilharzia regenti]|nr:unnamed protein product [Trichobilharzia regenti]
MITLIEREICDLEDRTKQRGGTGANSVPATTLSANTGLPAGTTTTATPVASAQKRKSTVPSGTGTDSPLESGANGKKKKVAT